jgi:Sel1 repeat
MKRVFWGIPRYRRHSYSMQSYEKATTAIVVTGISATLICSSPLITKESGQSLHNPPRSSFLCSCEKYPDETTMHTSSNWWNESIETEDIDSNTDEEQYSEAFRWEQALIYHRKMLPDYRVRWDYNNPNIQTKTVSVDDEILISQSIPTSLEEVSPLEYELQSAPPGSVRNQLLYRIAMFYCWNPNDDNLIHKEHNNDEVDEDSIEATIYQQRLWAIRALRSLALLENHVDAQYALGRISARGWERGGGGKPDSTQACVWYELASIAGHPQASYELGVALYTGEGMAEDEHRAVHLFEQAASLGHAQAAYMLGDCLLEGIGTLRDRAEALEWLVVAAELGHRTARSRVLAVLTMDDDNNVEDTLRQYSDSSQHSIRWKARDIVPEKQKWTEADLKRLVTLERQFTIGGGKRNPVVLARRKSVVKESRGDEELITEPQSLSTQFQGNDA